MRVHVLLRYAFTRMPVVLGVDVGGVGGGGDQLQCIRCAPAHRSVCWTNWEGSFLSAWKCLISQMKQVNTSKQTITSASAEPGFAFLFKCTNQWTGLSLFSKATCIPPCNPRKFDISSSASYMQESVFEIRAFIAQVNENGMVKAVSDQIRFFKRCMLRHCHNF